MKAKGPKRATAAQSRDQPSAAIKRKRGRPPVWTPERKAEAQAEIAKRLALGETLVAIERDSHMPDRTTIWDWEQADEVFANTLARARRRSAESHVEMAHDLAANAKADDAPIVRVRVDLHKWMATRFHAERFGDRAAVEHSGPGGAPIQTIQNIQVTFVRPNQG